MSVPTATRRTFQLPGGMAEQLGYADAVRVGDLVHVAGQLGVGPTGPDPDPRVQARVAFANVVEALRGVGAEPRHLVSMTSYHPDLDTVAAAGAAKQEVLGDGLVAWTVLAVPRLFDPAFSIEITAVAVVAEPAGSTE